GFGGPLAIYVVSLSPPIAALGESDIVPRIVARVAWPNYGSSGADKTPEWLAQMRALDAQRIAPRTASWCPLHNPRRHKNDVDNRQRTRARLQRLLRRNGAVPTRRHVLGAAACCARPT